MDEFLALVGVQAMRYAIRSGIALTSTYALGQCSRLLKSVEDQKILAELKCLRKLLDNKIKIISPAIDLIEFKCGRGNVFLESAAPLAKSLHQEIVSLGRRIENAASVEEELQSAVPKSQRPTDQRKILANIIDTIKRLLDRIDREIPLLQLAITASGESLSTSMPTGISPSRLLQASTFLIVGDTQFAQDPGRVVQIGPAFTLSLYMLFLGHASKSQPPKDTRTGKYPSNGDVGHQDLESKGVYGLGEGERRPLWKEVLHKARVRLCRTRVDYTSADTSGLRPRTGISGDHSEPSTSSALSRLDEYTYHLEIVEDLDDGRVHDDCEDYDSYDDIWRAGIRESIPIHQVSKIFYTDMGRILNIGNDSEEENKPILLLKRDIQAIPNGQPLNGLVSYLNKVNGEHYDEAVQICDSVEDEEQTDVERQIRRESADLSLKSAGDLLEESTTKWKFPPHLDPEWIALEVFEEDEDDGLEPDDEDSIGTAEDDAEKNSGLRRILRPRRGRSSLDSTFIGQIKNISLGTSTNPSTPQRNSLRERHDADVGTVETQDFVARSPFGTITTSLSLMEMLIRLASLQEFQQASHLSIPDHVLTFFLEETSTTGLLGDTQWKARNEAKKRMGFDPYTDTPTK